MPTWSFRALYNRTNNLVNVQALGALMTCQHIFGCFVNLSTKPYKDGIFKT